MQKELNPTIEKQITLDWQGENLGLGIYKPRHLLRRSGPLLVGVCLDRNSSADKYMPTFHVHCLCAPFLCVSLTLSSQLRTERTEAPDFIEVRWHHEKYKEASARMHRQCLLPLTGDLTLTQVLDAYRAYMSTAMGRLTRMRLYKDVILISVHVGDLRRASTLLDEAIQSTTDDAAFKHVGGRSQFSMDCRNAIDSPEITKQFVLRQIDALKLSKLPFSQLLP
ncbi:MAG: hypothetical protein QM811_29810 [Pirellulales bacterium]